jgi:N,N'-diacetyllegionaminate synthase
MINKCRGVYIIAEIGGNHEGSFKKAKELLVDAIDSGVDAVKFQVYTGSTLVNSKVDLDRVKHFDKFALTTRQYLDLADICNNFNIDFLASVWDENQILLFSDRMPFYKIGSGDLTAYPLLKIISKTGKPILLSTGLSNLEEVKASVSYIIKCNPIYKNKGMVGVLQCTSMYPIPDSDANLKAISLFKKEFPLLVVGYSDHTVGGYAAELAVTLGAKILELHFTDNKKDRKFRDHQVSFTNLEIKSLINKINKINLLLGECIKKPMSSEIESGHVISFRRGIYFNKDMKNGDMISATDLVALRPCYGIPAEKFEDLIGKKCNKNIKKLEVLKIADVI